MGSYKENGYTTFKILHSNLTSAYMIKEIKLTESVQRWATKLVQGTEHWKYDERLEYLELTGGKAK